MITECKWCELQADEESFLCKDHCKEFDRIVYDCYPGYMNDFEVHQYVNKELNIR